MSAPITEASSRPKPELAKALEIAERANAAFYGHLTVRVQMFNGSATRNLKLRQGPDGLYVITGKYTKHRKRLADMHDAVICYFDGQPKVVTYVEHA